MKVGETIKQPQKVVLVLDEVLVIDFLNNIMSLKELEDSSQSITIISLKDISDLYPNGCYKVINETPLGGDIYRYNNYGKNEWIKIGEMYGYA